MQESTKAAPPARNAAPQEIAARISEQVTHEPDERKTCGGCDAFTPNGRPGYGLCQAGLLVYGAWPCPLKSMATHAGGAR